jgi:hypothetical protein
VGEHDRLDVLRRVSDGMKIRLERLAELRQARIDRGQAAAVLDEVPVDELGAEPVDAGSDFDRALHPRLSCCSAGGV